jgi:Family of unknown function (DUF6941)
MPELDFAVLANAAQVSSDHLVSILGGGWDTGQLPEGSYPAGVVLTIAFRLQFDQEETGKPHTGEVVVEQEDGTRLAAVTFTVQAEWPEDIPAAGRRTPVRSASARAIPQSRRLSGLDQRWR